MKRALLAASMLFAVDAAADCDLPDPAVVWSFPADGDVDVPVDTKLWIVPTAYNTPTRVVVDGTELDVAAVERVGHARVFAIDVAADSDHVVEIAFDDVNAPDGGDIVVETIAFRTGAASVGVPDTPVLVSVVGSPTRELDDECGAILAASGCYDEGQDSHVVGALAIDAPLGWLVTPTNAQGSTTGARMFWPTTCGDPEYFTIGIGVAQCMSVQAVSAAGVSTSSNNRCEGAVDNELPGCSASASFMSMAGALGVLLRRRRRVARGM